MFSKVVDGFLLCSGFLFSLFSSSTDIIWDTPFWNRIISLLLAVSLPVIENMRTTTSLTSIAFEGAHIHVALEGISASQDAEMPYRRITSSDRAEANRVENAEWHCLAVAQIKAPSRCMD